MRSVAPGFLVLVQNITDFRHDISLVRNLSAKPDRFLGQGSATRAVFGHCGEDHRDGKGLIPANTGFMVAPHPIQRKHSFPRHRNETTRNTPSPIAGAASRLWTRWIRSGMIQLHGDFSSDPRPPPPGEDEARMRSLVEATFREGGWLQTILGLEHRPEQEHMALAVTAHILGDQPHFFEAGTGVGKSLAYLVPGLIAAISRRRPMVVSTHTIALQHQIMDKDLGICRDLFQAVPDLQPYADFRKALLVGRGNYVCAKRLALVLREKEDLFTHTADSELNALRVAMNAARPLGTFGGGRPSAESRAGGTRGGGVAVTQRREQPGSGFCVSRIDDIRRRNDFPRDPHLHSRRGRFRRGCSGSACWGGTGVAIVLCPEESGTVREAGGCSRKCRKIF